MVTGLLEYLEWRRELGNDSDMKRQPHRASGGNFTIDSAQKNTFIRPFYSRDTLRVCLRVHCITWVGFTKRNVSETCVQFNTALVGTSVEGDV